MREDAKIERGHMKAQTVLVSIVLFLATATVSAKEGFYSVTRDADGIWWGVRPDGTMFIPNGVVHVCLDPGNPNATTIKTAYGRHCLGKYGTQEAWATNILTRLRQWGFNIIDMDSDYDRLFKGGVAEAMGFGYAYGLYTHRPLQRGARRKDPNFCITPPSYQEFLITMLIRKLGLSGKLVSLFQVADVVAPVRIL